MKAPILTFFNNKGGVGKTSLIYHLAWILASLRKRVIAVDLDPQANLTAAFLEEDKIEALWNSQQTGSTIYHSVKPLSGIGDISEPKLQRISNDLYLIPGDVELSSFEDVLSNEWPQSMSETNLYRPLRILSSFWQVIQIAIKKIEADIVLIDIGPNLGAINRSVLIATDFVVIPLGADLFSLQGLKNLGPALRNWKNLWRKRIENWNDSREKTQYPDFQLPVGQIDIIGYLCQQHGIRLDKPVKAYDKWINRVPAVYREFILNQKTAFIGKQADDPYCLSTIKHYRSLMPMAQEVRKPIFNLTAADGAIGSHSLAVQDAKKDFEVLARKISSKIGVTI